jgi:hypothetical protein
MYRLKLKKLDLTLINLHDILGDIEEKIADDVYRYKLIPVKFNGDTTKLAYHHLILGICNAVKQQSTTYKVVVYDKSLTFMSEYTDIDTGQAFIHKTLHKFKNLLPVNLWESPYQFKMLEKILDTDLGERIEVEYHLKKFTDTRKKSLYSFNKIRKFGERYGLEFLTKNFFRKIENKQLIIG